MLETVDAGERPEWGDLWRRAGIGLLMRGLSVADLAFYRGELCIRDSRYQDAVKAIGEGYSFLQDVGVVSYEESHDRQSRYMANVAGAGFDARMVRKLSHLKKKGRKSRWRSTWCLVKNFFRYKSTGVKVWVDDRLVYNNLLFSIAIGICKYNRCV